MCQPTILAGSESDKPDLHFHEKEERQFQERARGLKCPPEFQAHPAMVLYLLTLTRNFSRQ